MADITIEAACQAELSKTAARAGIFWTSPTVGYVIFSDSINDLRYRKTSDGGANWGSSVIIRPSVTILAYDCWADWQTAGDSGTKIHIAYMDSDNDDIHYVYLDTNGDSVGGDDQIATCQGPAFLADYGRYYFVISITKTRGGNLAVAFTYIDTDSVTYYGFYTSPDATTWTSEASPWDAAQDLILLFPGNEADNQDVWAVYWDRSANEISLKTYDDSGDSWSEQSISTSMLDFSSYLQMDGVIRLSDGHLIFAAWNYYDYADADLKVWDINGAGSITAKTNILTHDDTAFLVSMLINQDNDDIYVAYTNGSTSPNDTKVFYKKSDDGGANWGSETAMQVDAADDERWVSCGAVKASWGGKFLPVWFNDDLDDLFCNTDNGISIAAAGAALEKSLSDTVAITDSLLKAIGLNKGDTVIIADSEAKTIGLVKAEMVTIADVIAKAVGIIKADTVAIADSIAKLVSLVKTDAVTISDSFDRVVAYVRALADTVTITDSISKAVSIVKADTMAITDAIVVGIGYALHIVLSDLVTIKDRLVGELRIKTYLKQGIARMQIKGMDIARMSIKRMGIARMPLFRWIIRRWTA